MFVCSVCGGVLNVVQPEVHFASYEHKRAVVVANLAKSVRR